MKQICESNLCTGCCACYNICSKQCITMQKNVEGFFIPVINEKECISCGLCENVCPVIQDKKEMINNVSKAYVAWSNNDQIRAKSSSGGIFSIVAEWILENEGSVFGAAFTEDWTVQHLEIKYLEEIKKLQGSKYVQSYVGKSFKSVRSILEQDKWVLFSGTPCQIRGLRRFLKKDYKKLICVDFVCHGVPSEIVWKRFLNKYCDDNEIKDISFRDKTYSWKKYDFVIEKKSGEQIRIKREYNNYMEGFIQNLFLRESCSNCNAKGEKRKRHNFG